MKDLDKHKIICLLCKMTKIFLFVQFDFHLLQTCTPVCTYASPKLSLLFCTFLCDVSFIFNTAKAGRDTDHTFAMAVSYQFGWELPFHTTFTVSGCCFPTSSRQPTPAWNSPNDYSFTVLTLGKHLIMNPVSKKINLMAACLGAPHLH